MAEGDPQAYRYGVVRYQGRVVRTHSVPWQ
jgi:hypothetical protein